MSYSFTNVKAIAIAMFALLSFVSHAQDLTDVDLKMNVQSIARPLAQVLALQPQRFEYGQATHRPLALANGIHYGFDAVTLKTVFPELSYRKSISFMSGKNSYKTATIPAIDMQQLIPVLVAALQEQQQQIDVLKQEVERLRK